MVPRDSLARFISPPPSVPLVVQHDGLCHVLADVYVVLTCDITGGLVLLLGSHDSGRTDADVRVSYHLLDERPLVVASDRAVEHLAGDRELQPAVLDAIADDEAVLEELSCLRDPLVPSKPWVGIEEGEQQHVGVEHAGNRVADGQICRFAHLSLVLGAGRAPVQDAPLALGEGAELLEDDFLLIVGELVFVTCLIPEEGYEVLGRGLSGFGV